MVRHLRRSDGREDRRYSTTYKLEILREVEGCARRGEIKSLLQRERLHSSLLSRWRRKFGQGGAGALETQKSGVNQDKPRSTFSTRGPLAKVVMIEQLRDLAHRLKRTPTVEDVSKASKLGKCVSAKTFFKVFGSYNAAIRKAALPLTGERVSMSRW